MQHTSANHPLKCVYCITPYVCEFFLFCIGDDDITKQIFIHKSI